MSPLLERARETLKIEIAGLEGLIERLGPEFEEAVNLLYACQGKVILAGMGKSGLIARKIAATLTSTGTPSLFLHAGESSHGDLGIITRQDVVIVFSYSGETSEVVQMIGHIHAIGVPLIAMTGKPESTLAQASTVHLSIAVEKKPVRLGLLLPQAAPQPWRWVMHWQCAYLSSVSLVKKILLCFIRVEVWVAN